MTSQLLSPYGPKPYRTMGQMTQRFSTLDYFIKYKDPKPGQRREHRVEDMPWLFCYEDPSITFLISNCAANR